MESKQTIKLHCLENRVASGYVTFGSYWEKGILVIPNFKNDGMDSFVLQNENKNPFQCSLVSRHGGQMEVSSG